MDVELHTYRRQKDGAVFQVAYYKPIFKYLKRAELVEPEPTIRIIGLYRKQGITLRKMVYKTITSAQKALDVMADRNGWSWSGINSAVPKVGGANGTVL